MASEGPEEEELWLYGGSPTCEENGSTPRHGRSPDALQNILDESKEPNNVPLQVSQTGSDDEEDSDTDSDDDVEVTIGDIRTGASSCMRSAGNVNLTSGKGYTASGKWQPKGIDFSAPGCINGLPVLDVDLDSFEDKPWRKPGADISDYFNYGFNEATWKVYCEKQRRLQMGLDTGYHSNCRENKITVLQGRTGSTEKGSGNGCVNSDLNANISVCVQEKKSTVPSPNRKMEEPTDVLDSVICNITTVQGRRWDNNDSEDISIQVLGDHGYKPPAPIHQPPPPLLPPPPNPHPFPGIPPPHFFHRPPAATHHITPSLQPPALLPPPLLPPPSVHIPPVNGPLISYNSRPPQRQNYNSIEPRLIAYQPPVSTAQSPWVTTTTTNSFSGNDWTSRRQQETERPRSLVSSNYKSESNRYQHDHRERSYEHERQYQRSADRLRERSWEREEKPRGEQRTRDREESSKHKSSRHKQDSNEQESHKRHKRKKSKRGKEEKSNSEDGGEGSRHSHRD